jgi:hypothetical protein
MSPTLTSVHQELTISLAEARERPTNDDDGAELFVQLRRSFNQLVVFYATVKLWRTYASMGFEHLRETFDDSAAAEARRASGESMLVQTPWPDHLEQDFEAARSVGGKSAEDRLLGLPLATAIAEYLAALCAQFPRMREQIGDVVNSGLQRRFPRIGRPLRQLEGLMERVEADYQRVMDRKKRLSA